MKRNFTRTLVVLAAAVLFIASCKKENKSAVTATADYKAMSSRLALSLYKGITGQYGGADVTKGITLPSGINVSSHAGLRVNSTSSLCGFVIDTTFTTQTTPGDTATTQSGSFHFVYTCSKNTPDGYMVHDSLTTTEGGKYGSQYIVSQNYTVQALDQTYKVVSMSGTMFTFVGIYSPGAFYYLPSEYKLNNLVVNFSSGVADVTSGTATFRMFGYQQSATPFDDGHPIDATGTITFLGNHMATLTIRTSTGENGTYLVNLQTGTVTKQ
jgi:hypothetical protein